MPFSVPPMLESGALLVWEHKSRVPSLSTVLRSLSPSRNVILQVAAALPLAGRADDARLLVQLATPCLVMVRYTS